jgi:hypothetical protein
LEWSGRFHKRRRGKQVNITSSVYLNNNFPTNPWDFQRNQKLLMFRSAFRQFLIFTKITQRLL